MFQIQETFSAGDKIYGLPFLTYIIYI